MPKKFQRARSEEQRAARRQAILDTAADMLAEMPVAQVSLNELSRRVCLAKSNVLRYFESREDVLLELLGSATRELVAHLEVALAEAVDPAPPGERADRLAGCVARALADRPVLCDLVSAQAAVLERNISPQVAGQFKREAIANATALAGLIAANLPELGERDAFRFVAGTVMVTGSVWAHAQPSAAMLAAYEEDPSLAVLRLDFEETLRETLEVLLSGLLARAERTGLRSLVVEKRSEES
ncbi:MULTISPECIES: TetR/AcrR family transcriptional regulator [unclassified Streptomyces]|uniref:TetR/AcrR family transcriptional regulator n=1 Tax=unclassified Streptomyces TaxID=2593676 RepID=UPI00224D3920|nr:MULTISPECIES: TetR/AcrR family transcriptional regulator [unclassified Streptomyces]MCX4524568.1 TetR/AcrR family transcriptional regulator [Streptomyces sp. NBC_01551]MCX4544908.1 TetR/AcrR family transcriptional regulator [Streptomyces sp. NBC_01565]